MTAITYVIEPIDGRSAIQKNFVTLPERASKYCNRHVTLNERFSIIERGYYLKPVELPRRRDDKPQYVSFVSMNTTSTEERIASGIAKIERKRMESQRAKSKGQEVSPCDNSAHSDSSISP